MQQVYENDHFSISVSDGKLEIRPINRDQVIHIDMDEDRNMRISTDAESTMVIMIHPKNPTCPTVVIRDLPLI
jgi:hypothetical protein